MCTIQLPLFQRLESPTVTMRVSSKRKLTRKPAARHVKSAFRRPAATYGYKKKVNSDFKTKHGLTYSKSSSSKSKSSQDPMSYHLKDLQMLSYFEVVAMTSAKACVWLQKHGVLLPPKTVRSFVCWICETEMKHDRAADTLRCTANKCTSNPRVLDPETMFTPLHATVSSGNEVQYDLFLICSFVLLMLSVAN